MTKPVVVVSLGRILADQVRVEPVEACAIVQQVHAWLEEATRSDEGLPPVPPLDALGITGFGDFQVRPAARPAATTRTAAETAADLGALLLRLVTSGRSEMEGTAATCVVIARRAMNPGPETTTPSAAPVTTPAALLAALAPFAASDPSAVLATLYARWMRVTDPQHAPVWEEPARPRPAPRPPLDGDAVGPFDLRQAAAESAPPAAASGVLAPGARPRRRRRGRRRAAVAAGATAVVLVMAGSAAWWRTPPSPAAPPAVSVPKPAAAGGPSYTEAAVAPPAARPATAGVRVRRLLDADATGRVPYSPSFDPRTRGLVFHAGVERTALLEASLDADGDVGAIRTVRDDGARAYHAQVSPDGSQLAFDSDLDGTRGIYVARRDGSAARRVSGPGSASVPTWSPDGETLAFARAEADRPRVWNVWTVHLPTGRMRRETSHRVGQVWGASWFPDGRRLAYSVEDRLVVIDRESGETRTWRTPVRGRLVRTPAVSPDGRRIVFQVHRDGAWVLDLERDHPERVLADRSAQEFAWAPDGARVAYHSVRGGEWGIWLMDVGQ